MVDINDIAVACNESQDKRYKKGWIDAVAYIDQHYEIKNKGDSAVLIELNLEVSEEDIANKINQLRSEHEQSKKRRWWRKYF